MYNQSFLLVSSWYLRLGYVPVHKTLGSKQEWGVRVPIPVLSVLHDLAVGRMPSSCKDSPCIRQCVTWSPANTAHYQHLYVKGMTTAQVAPKPCLWRLGPGCRAEGTSAELPCSDAWQWLGTPSFQGQHWDITWEINTLSWLHVTFTVRPRTKAEVYWHPLK